MPDTDFSQAIHPAVAGYRKRLADQGYFDERDDYEVVRFLAEKNPTLLESDPTFGQLYGQIREANAPTLGQEFGRAAKRATIGLGATALGGGALLTDSDYLRRKSRELDLMASDPDLAPTIPTLEAIRPGQDGIGQVLSRDALRYAVSKVGEVVPSAAEAAVTAGIGAAVGSAAAPGPRTVTGAVGGLLGRTLVKRAIRKLVTKELSEEAIERGLREGAQEIVEAVTRNAADIAKVGGATAASAVNSYVLNAGEVYNENEDRGTAAALGLVSAVPDTVLPALIVKRLFPGVSLSAGRAAAKEFVGDRAVKLAQAAGVTGFEAGTEAFQEAVNIVGRNLKENRDPFEVDDADLVRIREAGITGAFGGALASPAVVLGGQPEAVEPVSPGPAISQPAQPSPAATPVAPPAPVMQSPAARVRGMSPEQQVARLAELETRARVGDEEAEYEILRATVPREAQTPITPEVAQAVQQGNLPLAPQAATPAAVTPQTVLQEPAGVAGSAPDLGAGVETVPAPASTQPQEQPVVAAGRPPVSTDPAQIATDRAEYDRLQTQMRQMIQEGKTGTDEFNAVWQASEVIKNRHGGMPPGVAAAAPALTPSVVTPVTQPSTPAPDALQIQSPATLPLRNQPENGSPLGQGNAVVQEAAGTSAPAQTEAQVTPETLPDAKAASETVWYHGTGATIPDASRVTSTWTKINSLFGTGFYLTDNKEIADSYGKKRGGKGGRTYAVKVSPRAVLNLELPMTEQVAEILEGSVYDDFKEVVSDGLSAGKTTAQVISDLRDAVADQSQGDMVPESEYGQMFQEIEGNFRTAGIDAFTHVGGTRAGRGKKLHRVLIMLDPSGEFAASNAPTPKTVVDIRSGDDPIQPTAQPLPRSPEQRLNDAGIDLPPIAPPPAGRTAQTQTPEFKAWFGDSKVVDAEGKPLVVYHGTTRKNVKTIRPEHGMEVRDTAWFSDSEELASEYTLPREYGETVYEDADGNEIAPGVIVESYLSIKNPLVVDFEGDVGDATRLTKLVKQAKAAGHDGLIIKNVDDGIGDKGNGLATSYAIFSPTQVKSATQNRGTFDPTNPDITARTVPGPTNPAVNAQRTQEFQAVMGRLVENGANVQLFTRELLAQQTGEVLQQQISALEARLQQPTTAPQRNALTKQIALRQERLAEVEQMRGVTYNPYHIAIAMDDVMNASLDNLVTLLHEAAESLTMRLSPAQQGAVFRGVERATAQMQARMQEAARNTGATVADVPNPGELLAETLAQTLAAEGISDAPSLAQAIVRWIKEVYYRVAMAAQRAFGGEPSPELALQWYENQLRREVGGDYEYAFSRLLDRFLPQSNANFAAKFTGATGTPGGMPDFFDPTTQKLQQPWVEPTSDEALAWNMKFQTGGVNPGAEMDIPAEEAVARQTAAAYNEEIRWLQELHDNIAPTMDMAEFVRLVSRGEKTPHEMLDGLKTTFPGIETAEIGGERMTDAMNKWAAWQALKYMKGVQAAHLSRIGQMQESIKDAEDRFTEHARELNRLEPDVRNAELHEGELRKKARKLIDGLLASYKNGLRTSSKLGMMIEAEENLGPKDPLPQFYTQAYQNLLASDLPLFDYADALAALDLNLAEMTPEQIWKAIKDNADTSPHLRALTRNKPLALTMAVLARDNAREFDQIMLRRVPPKQFLDIKAELDGIRNATEAQVREMVRAIDEKNEAKGLRQRIRTAYLKERRALQRASDRIAQVEERMKILEDAKPAVAEKLAEMQQAVGGVFSEWSPVDGAEFIVMRRNDAGDFQRATRTLQFNKDGSAVDSEGIINDLAQNEQWLKANVARAGTKEYEQVRQQTRALQLLDVQRAYPAHNYGKIMGMIDAFVRPLQAIAKQAGHSVGNRIVQQFNKYEFINRSGEKNLKPLAYEWGTAQAQAMKAAGITDVGQFHAQIYNPVKFWLGVNPGLDRPAAIRGAIAEARKHLPEPPAPNFNERFEAFLLKDKEIEDELLRAAEQNNVLVWDEKLGELRKAIARGWSTGMRMMNDGVVVTLVHDMEKAGWKLEFDRDEQQKARKVVVRSNTFDALNPAKATNDAERAKYYAQLDNTENLRSALKPYFTPGIVERWLLPFINKPGEPVFNHDGRDIPQIDLQNAWATAGGDVLTWIDNLGQMLDVTPEDGVSQTAYFRWDMLRQLENLFKWEAGMAYEAEQTPDLFASQGSKLHVMMDARVNDLLPAEHVMFAMHDPTSVRQMLGQIAFHGAFGRNGQALMANLKELESVSVAKKFAFDALRSTTVEGKKREARERGYDYNDLKRAVDHYHDVMELKGEIESAMGVKNIYGPLYDARAGMEILGFMVGQVVDQPKTGALNFLSLGARPFAMHSFSPKVLKATALSYGELAKNSFGGLLRDFGIDLVRESNYAKETGEVEGKAFRRLPFGTVISGDPGRAGAYQEDLKSRFVVQPLRILRAIQKKGVGPGLAAIPGLGTMQRFSTEGAIANNRGQIFLLQEIINNGIRYFSAHPEDLNNPAFRFTADSLKLRGDRGMYDWFRNKTVEYNMGTIERIVRDAISRQAAGERTITTEMVEQLAQMNAQELDGASSINTAPAGLAQNRALNVALPLLRWPLWMMHAAHEGLADANGRADFKSMMRGIGRLAAWNLPLGLAFTFLLDEYDEKVLRKKNAQPSASPLAALPVVGLPLALATTPREIPQELLAIGQRMIRAGNIYGLGGDMAGAFIAPFDPGSGQRAFSLDQRVLVMSQFLNLTQAISNMVNQGGTATWGSVYRPMVASIGGNGMLNSLDVVNNLLGLDNAEARLTTRINAARWVNTAAKELGIETKKASGFSSPTEMSVWTREMQLAAMANSRADFMEAYRKALQAARERVAEDEGVKPEDREKEAVARVLASWRARNPFSGLATTATPDQINAMLRVMNEQGRRDVQDAMRYYDAYTALIKPSEIEQFISRRLRAARPPGIEALQRRSAGMLMAAP